MKYEIVKVLEEGKNSFVVKVKLSETGEVGVIKRGKNKEILKEEGSILRSLPKGLGPKWLGEWEEGDDYCLFMEYIEGQTLEEYVDEKGGRLLLRESVELMENITEEVGKLHALWPPILYRDLKPSNIIRERDGGTRLVDFGGALILSEKGKKWKVASPFFAAPEQFLEGARESKATDVYGLGAIFYFLLVGKELREIGEFPKEVGREWKDIIEKSMEWSPELRYPEASLLLFDIKRSFFEAGKRKEKIQRKVKKRRIRWEKNIHIWPDFT